MQELQVRLRAIACAAVFGLSCTATAVSAGSQSTPQTTLKSSSGGTALSKNGGTGGTGIPASANAPLGSLQSNFKPAHATTPPPAGVRPHTDLAASQKRTDLSSRSITKQSSLYNKIVLGPHDPTLAAPYVAKMGPVDGGGASFRQTPSFTAKESKGNVVVTSGGADNNSRESASLSSHSLAAPVTAAQFEPDEIVRHPGYGLLDWLMIMFATIATAGIGFLLWQEAPASARMMGPVKVGT